MALPIPEDKISEIRQAADIVDIVSEAVTLKKTGKNLLGLCPFHTEKTPSFTVSPEKQIFYCFGCGAGGNVFSFLMKQRGMTFPEAARMLAARYGVQIPSSEATPAQRRRMSEKEQLFALNREAMTFFRKCLESSASGRRARDYLGRRGMTAQIVERFELGYAPPGWDSLLRFLSNRRISPALMEKAGLIIARKEGSGYYDRFRDRIIFPIRDTNGRVVGFGGRVMGDQLPKYLNSPETLVYNKRNCLYGLFQARQACRAQGAVFIVEGYTDLLALHQHGIQNAVATLGTALTTEQIKLLKRFVGSGKIVLVFDGDAAGHKAAERARPILEQLHSQVRAGSYTKESGINTLVMALPQGQDPDSFLGKEGAQGFLLAAEKAKGILGFLMDAAIDRHGDSIEGKARVVRELAEPLGAVSDPITRALYVKQLAERLGIDESALLARVREFGGPRSGQAAGSFDAPQRPPLAEMAAGKAARLERQIVSMMLQYPRIVPEVMGRGLVARFENPALRRIAEQIVACSGGAPSDVGSAAAPLDIGSAAAPLDIGTMIQQMEDAGLQSEAAAMAMRQTPWNDRGCQRLLAQYEAHLERSQDDLTAKIRAAEASQDFRLLEQLLAVKQNRVRHRQELG